MTPVIRPGQDAEKMIAWLREAADELEKAHKLLDDCGVPRVLRDEVPMTLAARIAVMSGMIGLMNASATVRPALTDEQQGILNSLVTYAAENVPGGLSDREQVVARIVGEWALAR